MREKIATRMNDITHFFVMELLQRAKQLEQMGRDIIHMEIGESDFLTPQPIINAGVELLKLGQVKYTPAAGLPALREKVADFYQQQYGVKLNPKRVFITPGASGAFLLALGACLNPKDEVMMADPCYPCNSNFIKLYGGDSLFIPVDATTDYQLNASMIEENWSANTKAALIASPSNPTGTVISDLELKKAIHTVEKLNGCFFSDEIYHGLVYDRKAASALQYSDEVFVFNSFSKYFGMTGWRIGWLVVPEDFISAIEKLAQNIFISTATHSQYAALQAFSPENLQELERRRQIFAQRRDFLYQSLLSLGFDIAVKPEGAFYIYANCAKFTDDSFKFAQDLLETEGVAVTPGKDFGQHLAKQYLRFAYTTSIDRMSEAMQRLEKFLNKG